MNVGFGHKGAAKIQIIQTTTDHSVESQTLEI